ncbi:MAG: hypothetical protein JWQ88_3538 [Rhodoferax sp.]|nr:hypothetical protein [Rhodoferax sp.]
MNRIVFPAAFAMGLVTVAWVGIGLVGSSLVGLAMTAAIAAVYVLGALELRRYRSATAGLAAALGPVAQPVEDLAGWLKAVPVALQNAVRSRIEGERVGLPGPALTPYLIGLLVMLGMLGTFLGMVVTFKGAVFALEGSADLVAVRSALAAPIKGLGLAFGTSVAGVATSAMLGLMSAMSRRERAEVVRVLDGRASTVFRPFSLGHQRQEAYRALQAQAHALPAVADRLQAMMDGLERRSQQLNDQLLGQQAQFHREVTTAYTGLAASVGTSLQDSLAAGARAAGESIAPVVQAAMSDIADTSKQLHQQVFDTARAQLEGLSNSFGETARAVTDGWTGALQIHARTSDGQADRLDRALAAFTQQFDSRSHALVAQVGELASHAQAEQARAEQQRLQGFTGALDAMASSLHTEWRQLGADALAEQAAARAALEHTVQAITAQANEQAARTQTALAGLTAQSEALLQARTESEARWTGQQAERMAAMAELWRTELAELKAAESTRGDAAVARLGELQGAMAEHLATLGTALEQPMTRVLQAASEAPRAAAEVLAQLRSQSDALLQARADTEARWNAQQAERMAEFAELWRTELAELKTAESTRGDAAVARLGELQGAMAEHLATLGTALEQPMTRVLQAASEAPRAAAEVLAQLRSQSDALLQARADTEARWNVQQAERMAEFSELWRTELTELKTAESARGDAAVARLGELQAALGHHLATLGTSLEAPMTRLMETASEAPRAAAEVIANLREEMSRITERDNLALEERSEVMAKIGTLLSTLEQASGEHRAAIDGLVASATEVLAQAGSRFAETLGAEAGKAADVALQVSGSAVELASLGEAFHHGVQLFSTSNEKLVENLQRIEAAIGQSAARSDEQLAYYVAQARELIDLSMSSQQDIVEDLRRLRHRETATADGTPA